MNCLPLPFKGDQVYVFYYGCALALEGRVQEAIRELNRCINDSELMLGSLLVMIYSHGKCQTVGRCQCTPPIPTAVYAPIQTDHDAVKALEKRVLEAKSRVTEMVNYWPVKTEVDYLNI